MRLSPKRGRTTYPTHEHCMVSGYHGESLCRCDQTPATLLPIARKMAVHAWEEARAFHDEEWFAIFTRGGDLFFRGELPAGEELCSPAAHDELVCRATGMPITAVRKARKAIGSMLASSADILAAQSPDGTTGPFRTLRVNTSNRSFAWIPQTRALAVIPPSNHPAVHCLWLLALAARIPVILSPSEDEPFTPFRLAEALYAAGLPDGMLQVLPGSHAFKADLLGKLEWGLVFGNDEMLDRFSSPRIKGYGPGRSKIVVNTAVDDPRTVGHIVRSLMADGGRGCINASALLAFADGRLWAERIAQQVAGIEASDPLDESCKVGVFKNIGMAYGMNALLEAAEQRGATDLAAQKRHGQPRLVPVAQGAAILPSVLFVPATDPLFGAEFLFPFLAVAEIRDDQLLRALKRSLTVTTIGLPLSLAESILLHPDVGKVYDGKHYATTDIDLREPHEGLLADFLFAKKAVR